MAETCVQRRLAAIAVLDVVGYSRMMEMDETGTLAELKVRRVAILQPILHIHGGRTVKVMGDGALIEFSSAVHAVTGAMELQQRMAEANTWVPEERRIVLRIGINVGDVVVEGSDLYGNGVNVAARLERLAEPGEIYVSRAVHEQIKCKFEAGFDDLGPKVLKNISEPVHVYRVRTERAAKADSKVTTPVQLPLPVKPSIAVLPFTNMSGDTREEAFTDGLTEDLITDLSRIPGLFVVARHSTFAYKGRPADIRLIARELGVRYVLEGSARRAAVRVRINAQLIDATSGNHLWAERFDRRLDDVFAVQDEVIDKIIEALVGRLATLPYRNQPSIDAYNLCTRTQALCNCVPRASREVDLRRLYLRITG
jgi:TolB-like protein/class 3 adenylate cyclase